jgi:ribosomal protein S27AE
MAEDQLIIEGQAAFERNAHAAITVDGVEIAHSMQCPHCGNHFVSIRGSGKRRVWCGQCAAVTCGDPSCDAHIPFEARLDHAEGKRTRYTDLIIAEELKHGIHH